MMSGRQVCIYDKALEARVNGRTYLYAQWGIDQETYTGQVWRVEVRAGKAELDRFGLRTFDDLRACAGDVALAILDGIRYVTPSNDSHRARWPLHPLWSAVRAEVVNCLRDYVSHVARGDVIREKRDGLNKRYADTILSGATSLTALADGGIEDVARTFEAAAASLQRTEVREKIVGRLEKAKERFALLSVTTAPPIQEAINWPDVKT